jgi:hypothetical protein
MQAMKIGLEQKERILALETERDEWIGHHEYAAGKLDAAEEILSRIRGNGDEQGTPRCDEYKRKYGVADGSLFEFAKEFERELTVCLARNTEFQADVIRIAGELEQVRNQRNAAAEAHLKACDERFAAQERERGLRGALELTATWFEANGYSHTKVSRTVSTILATTPAPAGEQEEMG